VKTSGDATITWRKTNLHTVASALQYVVVSAPHQTKLMDAYIKKARVEAPALHRRILIQYAVWIGAHVAVLAWAIALHGVATGLYAWAAAMAWPSFFALWAVMLLNYDQHVHTDAFDAFNHSRSFKGRSLNFLLFNNGFHCVHHEHPGTHWSKLPALHRKVEHRIHPSLNLRSVWLYWIKQYVLAPFFSRFGTVQLGADPTLAAAAPEGVGSEGSLGEPGSNNGRMTPVHGVGAGPVHG
jgi:hypothetical protein